MEAFVYNNKSGCLTRFDSWRKFKRDIFNRDLKDKWDGELKILFDRDFFNKFSEYDNRNVFLSVDRSNSSTLSEIEKSFISFNKSIKISGVMSFPNSKIVKIDIKGVNYGRGESG